MNKLTLVTCREDATISAGTLGHTAFGAVMIKEHLSTSGRVVALGTQTEIVFRPGNIYKAYTGLKFPPTPVTVRASKEAWKSGSLEVMRTEINIPVDEEGKPLGYQGELEVFFRVSAEFSFVRMTPLFELWTPEGATVSAGEKAPIPSIASTQGERAIVPLHPAKPAADPANPGMNEDAAAEQAAKDWLNSPDDRGHVVANESTPANREVASANVSGIQVPDAGADQRVNDTALSSFDAAQTAGDNQQAAAMHEYQANPQAEGYVPKDLNTEVAAAPTPPAPPTPPTSGTDVESVDLSQVL